MTKGAAFLADSHFDGREASHDSFLTLLPHLPPLVDRLFLVGDLFRIWVGRADLLEGYHREVLGALARLAARGVAIDFVEGNRDFGIDRVKEAGGFRRVARESIDCDLFGRRYHIAHGDLVNLEDRQYQRWRAFARSAPVQGLTRVLPRGWLRPLLHNLEVRIDRTNQYHKSYFPEAMCERYCRVQAAAGADVVVVGHFHVARTLTVECGERTVTFHCLPPWLEEKRFMLVTPDGATTFPHVSDF